MDSARLRRELNRFDPRAPIEEAWTPPAAWYTSHEWYDHERRAVFARTWQPVARTDQVPEPGDFISGCLAGEPWVVVRKGDGSLAAFHNTCRHKGREVVVGAGNAESLVCGYHAWTYDLDGRLRSAPRMAGVRDFDREAMSLPKLRTEIWGPWVFINGDPEAPPLRTQVHELDRRLETGGWSDLEFYRSKSWDIACNWKVYADNYLDGGYHIPHMHPTLDAQLDMQSYRTEIFDTYSIQSSPPASEPDPRIDYEAKNRIGDQALYAWLYPNFAVNRYGPCLDSNYILPLGPDRCRVVYDFFFKPSAGEAARESIEASIRQSDLTQEEDIAICESVQRGLSSTSYDRGRYAPRVETGEFHFHRLLHRAFSKTLPA